MNTETHTGLPWIEQDMPRGMNDRITADDGEGKTICEFPYGLNADSDFIVRACNAHDELVSALMKIADSDERPGHVAYVSKAEVARIARAVLEKVEAA